MDHSNFRRSTQVEYRDGSRTQGVTATSLSPAAPNTWIGHSHATAKNSQLAKDAGIKDIDNALAFNSTGELAYKDGVKIERPLGGQNERP